MNGDRGAGRLTACVALSITLLVAACGSDDSGGAAPADPTPTVEQTPEDPVETIDLDEWADEVIAAWDDWNVVRFRAATVALDGLTGDVHRLDWTQEFAATEYDGLESLVAALPAATPPEFASEYETFTAVLTDMRDANRALYDLGAGDPDAVRAELDAVGDNLPEAAYGQAWITYGEFDGPLDEACFALQQAMVDAGLGLVDCTASDVDETAAREGLGSDDPLTEGTGVLTLLPAGDHDVSIFGPGLRITTQRELEVTTSADAIVFRQEPEGFEVSIVDAKRLIDPANVAEDPGVSGWIDRPDTLDEWIAGLPVDVVATGTLEVGVGEATFWELKLSTEALEQGMFLGYTYFNGNVEAGESASMLATPPEPDIVTTLVDWHRGADRILIGWELRPEGDSGTLGMEIVAGLTG